MDFLQSTLGQDAVTGEKSVLENDKMDPFSTFCMHLLPKERPDIKLGERNKEGGGASSL